MIIALLMCSMSGLLLGTGHILIGGICSYLAGIIVGYNIAPAVRTILKDLKLERKI